jgi:hypothetical protein
MSKDDRVFKVTRTNGRVQYCARNAVSGMFSTGYGGAGARTVAKVEATNAEATAGWTDVTAEFTARTVVTGCPRHRTYTGSRKPGYRWYSDRHCTCWKIYGDLHPAYPKHSIYCGKPASDPLHCDCKAAAKILGLPACPC